MPCEITFETTALNDAVSKAARVAPTKGDSFDKAAGLLMDVNIDEKMLTVTANDLTVAFKQQVKAIEAKGDNTVWRLPSGLFSDVIASLPATGDSQVTLIDRGDGPIRMKCGRTIGSFDQLNPEAFPRFPEQMTDADYGAAMDMSTKVEQVAWSCDPKGEVLSGVYMNGKYLYGTNRQSMARVPCEVPLPDPVIVPLSIIVPILKTASDLRVTATEKRFWMQLDPETEACSFLIEGRYPNVEGVARDNFLGYVDLQKQALGQAMDKLTSLIKSDRQPVVQLEFRFTGLIRELVIDTSVAGVGRMQDAVAFDSAYDGDDFDIEVLPNLLTDAVRHTKGQTVRIHFGHPDPAQAKKQSLKISDTFGYECWMVPVYRSGSR